MIRFLKNKIKNIQLETVLRRLLNRPKLSFDNSSSYWERRYQNKKTSGAGSYGRLATMKANVLNEFVEQHNIQSVIEFGSGDGNQLDLANYPYYIGVDVSQTAIQWCKKKFNGDSSKIFIHLSEYYDQSADLSLSLDVIYHLIEDEIFENYMANLFDAGTRFVIVYSSNYVDPNYAGSHVLHRRFTDWVATKRTNFRMIKTLANPYPYKSTDPKNTSFSDFYFYERISS